MIVLCISYESFGRPKLKINKQYTVILKLEKQRNKKSVNEWLHNYLLEHEHFLKKKSSLVP